MPVPSNANAITSEDEFERIGSRGWVRSRLVSLPSTDPCHESVPFRELLEWLYTVVQRRARSLDLPGYLQADIAQDAIEPILRALDLSRVRIAQAENPAAVLERVASRAVGAGRHDARMAGLAGIPANGRNWRASYPRYISGQAADRLLEALPMPADEPAGAVEDTAGRLSVWVLGHLDIRLSPDAVNATVYILDRLVAGVSRASLVRGGDSNLAADPAMRHLGFDPAGARAFAVWLLGRDDPKHNAASVLDAFVEGVPPAPLVVERWRRRAVKIGFAAHRAAPDRTSIEDRRGIRIA